MRVWMMRGVLVFTLALDQSVWAVAPVHFCDRNRSGADADMHRFGLPRCGGCNYKSLLSG
jgi:hypothetical protein